MTPEEMLTLHMITPEQCRIYSAEDRAKKAKMDAYWADMRQRVAAYEASFDEKHKPTQKKRKTKWDYRFIPESAKDKRWMRWLRKVPWVKWGYAWWTPPERKEQ